MQREKVWESERKIKTRVNRTRNFLVWSKSANKKYSVLFISPIFTYFYSIICVRRQSSQLCSVWFPWNAFYSAFKHVLSRWCACRRCLCLVVFFFRIVAVFQSGGGVGVYALTSFSGTSERLNSPVIYVCIYKFMFAAVGISSSVLLFAWIIAHTMHGKSIPPSPHRIRNAHAINTTENMFKSNM